MSQIHRALEDLNLEQEIVVVCHHGVRSLQVAHILEYQGFTKVFNLEGGVDAWARDVDREMPRY